MLGSPEPCGRFLSVAVVLAVRRLRLDALGALQVASRVVGVGEDLAVRVGDPQHPAEVIDSLLWFTAAVDINEL